MQPKILIQLVPSAFLLFATLAKAQSTPPEPPPAGAAQTAQIAEPFIRREPVLPANLPDYELTTLDISKEVVFHLGERTYISRVPIMIYVPVNRAGRAQAVDRLIEARTLLVKAAASREVTTADLGALRDLIEQSISDLRAPVPRQVSDAPAEVSPPLAKSEQAGPPPTLPKTSNQHGIPGLAATHSDE